MATVLYIRDTKTTGMGVYRDMLKDTPGTAVTTGVVNTTASGTEIQWTKTGAGELLAFISGRVPAGGFTLSGTLTFSMWAEENNMSANCGIRCRLFKYSAGVETEISSGWAYGSPTELSYSGPVEYVWTGSPASTALAENDRLVLKVYIINVGTMAAGYTCTLSYDAAAAGTGDSYLQINETVTFKAEDATAAKVGSFTLRTTTGSQAVTGVGFQPKALLLFVNQKTADGNAVNAYRSVGFAASASQKYVVCGVSLDAQATSDGYKSQLATSIIQFKNTAGALLLSVSLTSLDPDGFTLNVLTSDATAYIVDYLALAGTSLSNAYAGSFATGTVTGDVAVTGVGFVPDALILIGTGRGDGLHFLQDIGMVAGTTQQAAMAGSSQDGVATTATRSILKNGSAFLSLNNAADTVFHEATIKSMDAGGFTLTFSINGGTSSNVYYLALKGGTYAVGSDTQKTSTGTKATAVAGITPVGLLLGSINLASSASVQPGDRSTLGFGSGTAARGCLWFGDSDNVSGSIVDSDLDRTKILKMMTEGTPSLNAAADLSSLDPGGFTLNWGTADAVAREFLYFAFGNAYASGPSIPVVMQNMRGGFQVMRGGFIN